MTDPQHRAADPEHSAWVSAHAGSGKTYVLINRVLRLLLNNVSPDRILCLTFTKAAAAEMAERLHERLGEWALMAENELAQEIKKLEGKPADDDKLSLARRLFALTLETSQGPHIQTIHAFCQSVLKRFPIEAGISPSFRVMDEPAARAMMLQAQNIVLAKANQQTGPLNIIAQDMNDAVFADIFSEIISKKRELLDVLKDYQKKIENLARNWQITPDDWKVLRKKIITQRDETLLREAAQVLLGSDKDSDKTRGAKIIAQIEARDPHIHIESYINIFLTQSGQPRKQLITKRSKDHNPDIAKFLPDEQNRIFALVEKSNTARALRLAAAIASLAEDFLKIFSRLKAEKNLLDYDDLITKTLKLFEQMDWVLYKLDGGLDHILLDEAQDTNPEQWKLIECLTEEFFAGQGSRENEPKRTLFAVGDPKQSIFGFQGVRYEKFAQMKTFFEQKAKGAQENWENVKLDQSRRSLPKILRLVDQVFTQGKIKMGEGAHDKGDLKHTAHRAKENNPGHIEIWPQFEKDGAKHLARAIAEKIVELVSLKREEPKEIMILVRRRNVFVEHLTRALKERGLPVAGSDRLQLDQHLAIMDLLSLAKFVLLPEDDLSLAEVLKSPLCNLSEEQLMALALARLQAEKPSSLWAELGRQKETYKQQYDFLSQARRRADFVPVFEFFSEILEAQNMRAHFVAALGAEAHDPLDEFLNLALAYEQTQTPSLQGFTHWIARAQVEVKRDMERGHDEIRIMTVHGAKGLEAKIVFLVDVPPRNPPHHWMPIGDTPFWRMSNMPLQKAEDIREQNKIKSDFEENRLLYVAMTRAKDQLYVCGYHKKGESVLRWLPLIAAHSEAAEPPKITKTELISDQEKDPQKPPDKIQGKILAKVKIPAAQKRISPSSFLPSGLKEAELPESFSLLAPEQQASKQKTAMLSGSLMHEALRYAPRMNPEKLPPLLRRLFPQKTKEECEDIVQQAYALMAHEELAFCFEQGIAEVPVSALFDEQSPPLVISGRIDRLILDEKNRVAQIIDYKTDKNPPEKNTGLPAHYIRQLAAYRAVIKKTRPDWDIQAALLWTRIPRLDWLAQKELDNHAKMFISNAQT